MKIDNFRQCGRSRPEISSAVRRGGPLQPDPLDDLRVADLSTVLIVHQLSSVTASARHLGVTPSQVSKAVTRVERHLGATLFNRSAKGVALTDAGRRLLPRLDEIFALVQSARKAKTDPGTVITLAAPSYMNAFLLPAVAAALPELRVRALELPPAMVRTLAATNLFEVALLLGEPRLPSTWAVTQIGSARKALFATPAVARDLGRQPVPVEKLHGVPFVSPVYVVGGQYVPVDDDCPLPPAVRRAGHETQTIGVALELAASSGQLVYGPVFAAARLVASGALVEVAVEGWAASDPVHVACCADRMLARVQSSLIEALRSAFSALNQ